MAFLKEDDLIALSYHTLTPFSIFFPAVHVCKKEQWDFMAKYFNTEGPCYPHRADVWTKAGFLEAILFTGGSRNTTSEGKSNWQSIWMHTM